MIGYHGGAAKILKGRVWVAFDREYAEAHGQRHAGDAFTMHEIPLDGLAILDLSDLSTDGFIREEMAEVMRAAGVSDEVCDRVIEEYDADNLWWLLDMYDYVIEGIQAAGYTAIKIRETFADTRVGEDGREYDTVLILDHA